MKNRRILAVITALAMVFASFSVSIAAEETAAPAAPVFADVTDHWGQAAVEKWAGFGIIKGYEGYFRPDDSITRGEMAVILDNMMDYQVAAQNTFWDLPSGQFYTDAILKANAAGIMLGYDGSVRPTEKITKEEAAVMLARAFSVAAADSGKTKFLDADKISSWAQNEVFGMELEGYVNGYGGMFNPQASITRAEVVTIIDNAVKAFYNAAGTYTGDVAGIAIVNVTGVTIDKATITKNLIIAEGVGQGEVTLNDITVKGELVVRGGGENSVHITGNSSVTKVTVEKIGDKIRIVVSDGSTVSTVEVAAGEEIIISGTVGTLQVEAPDVTISTQDATISTVNINGAGTTLNVDSQSTIKTVNSTAKTTVTGTGTVTNVKLDAGADGSSITTPNTKTTVASGVTGVTGGGGTAIPPGSTATNNSSGTAATVTTTPSGGGGGGGGGSTVPTPSISIQKVTSGGVEITPDGSGVYTIPNTATKNNTGIDVTITNTGNVSYSITLSVANENGSVVAYASAGAISQTGLDILNEFGYVTFDDLTDAMDYLAGSKGGWYYDAPGHITSGNDQAALEAAIDAMFARMTDNEVYVVTVTLTPAGGTADTEIIRIKMAP